MAYKTKQLQYWTGNFGDAYIKRNSDLQLFQKRSVFYTQILTACPDVASVLEVGCNIGGNLYILNQIKPKLQIFAVEPNQTAAAKAQQLIHRAHIENKSIFDLGSKQKFDLVFTANVLIHISDADLAQALDVMYKASQKYILIIEYYSDRPEVVEYRGLSDALFKRPYDQIIQSQFPNLTVLSKGYVDEQAGFDRSHWWLYRKT